MSRIKAKFIGLRIRMIDAFRLFPIRLKRFFLHFFNGILTLFNSSNDSIFTSIILWWSELVYIILDLFAIPELYETLQDFLKFNTRPLSQNEIELARTIFGNSIHYERVRVDEKAQIGCRHFRFLYVSFYTINAWGTFNKSLLIHELMHVWQFQKFGGVYIPRAIKAINSTEGYNYGGIQTLRTAVYLGKSLTQFNYEQQADIITDYFRLKNGLRPQWGSATTLDLDVYKKFAHQLELN